MPLQHTYTPNEQVVWTETCLGGTLGQHTRKTLQVGGTNTWAHNGWDRHMAHKNLEVAMQGPHNSAQLSATALPTPVGVSAQLDVDITGNDSVHGNNTLLLHHSQSPTRSVPQVRTTHHPAPKAPTNPGATASATTSYIAWEPGHMPQHTTAQRATHKSTTPLQRGRCTVHRKLQW